MGGRALGTVRANSRGLASSLKRPEAVPPTQHSSTFPNCAQELGLRHVPSQGGWRLNPFLARPRAPGCHRRWVLVPAFLFLQLYPSGPFRQGPHPPPGVPKPPTSAAPSLGTSGPRRALGSARCAMVLIVARRAEDPMGAGAEGPHYSHPGVCTPASALLQPGWGRGGSWHWEKLQSLPPSLPLTKASRTKGDSRTCQEAGQERGYRGGVGSGQGLCAPSLSRPLGVGGLGSAAGLGSRGGGGGAAHPPQRAEAREASPTLLCTEPQFPRTRGAPANAH